jgi:hypothetical protein
MDGIGVLQVAFNGDEIMKWGMNLGLACILWYTFQAVYSK